MKISAINQSIPNKSFQGLWRQSKKNTDVEPILSVPKIKETHFYHPFADESQEKIQETIKSINKAEVINENGTVQYHERECRLCLRLPFTQKEFEAYSKITNGFVGKREKAIHEAVQGKFLNSTMTGDQKSASNPHIAEII